MEAKGDGAKGMKSAPMELTPPELDARLAQLELFVQTILKDVRTTHSALAKIINLVEPMSKEIQGLAPIISDLKARFWKDGKLKFPGLFS